MEAPIEMRVAWVGGRGGVDHGWVTDGDEYCPSSAIQLSANGNPGTPNGALVRGEVA